MNKTIGLLISGAIVIGGLIYTNNLKTTSKPSVLGTNSSTSNSQAQIINVEGGSFYFKPNEIRVKKGQRIEIVFKSVSYMHNFVIDELNVKSPLIKDGDTGEVEFTADRSGSYTYYCGVGQHRQQGQEGKLIVE